MKSARCHCHTRSPVIPSILGGGVIRFATRFGIAGLFVAGPVLCAAQPAAATPTSPIPPSELEAGRALYLQHCFICHQLNGQGLPGVYPPLAGSDYLRADRERAVRVVVEGLRGPIEVNGKQFDGFMPPVVLDDAPVARVLNYVGQSWGNSLEPFTAEFVKEARAKTQFPTFTRLQRAMTYAPLPKPPEGFTLREVVKLPDQGVRMASNGRGEVLFVLTAGGDVYRLVTATGELRQILWAKKYLEKRPGDAGPPLFVLGMTVGPDGRLYIASNQQNEATLPVQNIVTIYRTEPFGDGDPADPRPWFQTSYPGNAAYIHAVEHIAFGPDGFLYAGNGARTDGGLPGDDPRYFQGGETPVTACLWRIDPTAEQPGFEIFARGIRNAYGFCWNDRGEMFATENGPDAHAPEELNHIEQGKHYGFPYQYADWKEKAYPNSPDAPPGLAMTLPIANLGPDGGYDGRPLYTFDPHSGPGGIVWLGEDFPEGWRGTLLFNRFGNFLDQPRDNVGFDILQAKLRKNAGGVYEANIHKVLGPLGRPIDVHLGGRGRIFILEYTRPTTREGGFALPGRVLELAVKPPNS